MFHVGQRVVCVDASVDEIAAALCGDRYMDGLRTGGIYTIRETGLVHARDPLKRPALRLVEIVRRCRNDSPFFASRFRPVVERKTDISIFTKLLTPTPARENETA